MAGAVIQPAEVAPVPSTVGVPPVPVAEPGAPMYTDYQGRTVSAPGMVAAPPLGENAFADQQYSDRDGSPPPSKIPPRQQKKFMRRIQRFLQRNPLVARKIQRFQANNPNINVTDMMAKFQLQNPFSRGKFSWRPTGGVG
jgi:hypothetical protein